MEILFGFGGVGAVFQNVETRAFFVFGHRFSVGDVLNQFPWSWKVEEDYSTVEKSDGSHGVQSLRGKPQNPECLGVGSKKVLRIFKYAVEKGVW